VTLDEVRAKMRGADLSALERVWKKAIRKGRGGEDEEPEG
jgi:hypothetical protein